LTGRLKLAFDLKITTAACIMPVAQMLNLISVYTTVIVIWQRYVGVCMATKAKKYVSPRLVRIQTTCVGIASVLLYLPAFCLSCFMRKTISFASRTPAFHAAYTIFYDMVLLYTISYLVPVVSLVTMSVRLLKALRNMQLQSQASRSKRDMTFSLVVIVVGFVICQSVAPIRRILRWQYPSYKYAIQCGGDLFYFAPLEVLAFMVNSSSNFFVLVVCARGFRAKLVSFFKSSSSVAPAVLDSNPTANTIDS
jgi:hypothetical protein